MIISFPSDYIEHSSRDISIYQYRKGYNLQYISSSEKEEKSSEKLSILIEKIAKGEYSRTDIEIMKALFRFKYLNKCNLVRYLNKTNILPNNNKKIDYDSNLNRMRKEGIIIAYLRDGINEEDDNCLLIFSLSLAAYDYINSYGNMQKTYKKDEEYVVVDTAEVLEVLSLNQWHITMLINKQYIKAYYRKRFKKNNGTTFINSAFLVNVAKETYGYKTMMLYAFALPKKEDGQSAYINHLLSINSYLQSAQSPTPLSLIIITCESIKRMKDAYASVRVFKELDEIEMMFVLDEDMMDGTGVDRLYMCEYNSKTKGVTYYTTQVHLFKNPNFT